MFLEAKFMHIYESQNLTPHHHFWTKMSFWRPESELCTLLGHKGAPYWVTFGAQSQNCVPYLVTFGARSRC